MKKWRQYLSSLTVVAIFVVLAGAAFAAEGLLESPDPSVSPSAEETVISPAESAAETTEDTDGLKSKEESKEDSEEESEEESETPSDGTNHGQCVSKWAHESKTQGLKGKARGHFVSSIARDKTAVGTDCDFQAQLTAALEGSSGETAEEADQDSDKEVTKDRSKAKRSSKGKGKDRKR